MEFLNLCNEKEYVKNRTNATCETAFFESADKFVFDDICKSLVDNGYTKEEERNLGDMHIFCAYRKKQRRHFCELF